MSEYSNLSFGERRYSTIDDAPMEVRERYVRESKSSETLPLVDLSNERPALDDFYSLHKWEPQIIPDNSKGDALTDFVPDDYIKLASSTDMLRVESLTETYENLPRLGDGRIDLEKVEQARKTAIEHLRESNTNALSHFANRGIYKEQINNLDWQSLLVTPELLEIAKNCGLLEDHSTGYGVHDLNSNILEFIGEAIKFLGRCNAGKSCFNDEKLDSFYKEVDSYIDSIIAELSCKSEQEIRNNIDASNIKLQELEALNLDNSEDLKTFLSEYQNLTGTSFSADGIIETESLLGDETYHKDYKIENVVKNFGIPQNEIDSLKNEQSTNAHFNALSTIVPSIICKLGVVGRAVGTTLAYQMENAEYFTNEKEFDFFDFLSVNFTATKKAFIANLGASGGFNSWYKGIKSSLKEVYSKTPILKVTPKLNTFATEKVAINGGTAIAEYTTNKTIKGMLPDE